MNSAKQNLDIKTTALESAIGDALTLLGKENPSIKDLRAIVPQIERCRERYLEAGDVFMEKMLNGKVATDVMTQEEMLQSAIYGKTEAILLQIEDVVHELKFPSKAQKEDDEISFCGSLARTQGHHRLPKLELPKFGGEARDWLAFWSAFKTVHDDDSITAAVKFQYLVNCMIPGSIAQDIVASYPATQENYAEAVSSLEERFGRADMLVEVYVRDLIGLNLENAHKSFASFSSLYVKLSSQLRALGSLGVTTAKCAAILLPMVESTLPEDILQAWQRSRPQIPVNDKEKTSEITLEEMMKFLKSEVEGSERIRLARQPFSSTNSISTRTRSNKATIAAAASLVATEEKDKTACGRLLTGRKVDLNCGITALETVFGWTLSGEIPDDGFALSCHVRDVALQDLWNLDIIGIQEPLKEKSRQEMQQAAMDFFKSTVKQKKDGRYIVNLPWIEGHDPIPNYKGIVEKKLHNNKSRLEKLGVLQAYQDVFASWEQEGVIERINSGKGHYLSHHGVLKPESQTTPVRPVFNASFKCKGSPSLNSCLEVGPNMLEEIPSIITRFRMGPVGVVSDIRKAFLQIEVAEEDRDFLRCLWYKDATFQDVQEFRHCRVVFGVSSSPFLLQAVLDHHLSRSLPEMQETANLLKRSFYVDNCCASLSSMGAALKFKEDSTKLLESAQMDLRCWEIGPSSEEKIVPVLGLTWNLQADGLSIDLNKTFKKIVDKPVTKRIILSVAYSVFDPIGVSCAYTIVPKMLLQETCNLKTGWDSPLPDDISSKFISWINQLTELEKLEIPRCMAINQDRSTWELHTFTDASSSAYAACTYLRSGVPGKITVQLVMARARVAPIKDSTIPRLELIGCLCGARLTDKVKKMLEIPEIPTVLWSYSTTALAWIKNERTWGVFVSARVNEIRKLSNPDNWKHVIGKQNPADIPSRGSTVKTLIEMTWWEGPTWLYKEEPQWPTSLEPENKDEILKELKKSVVCHTNLEQVQLIQTINKRSDYFLIVRTVVYMLRWKSCFKSKNRNILVTPEEFASAERKIWKLIQQNAFSGIADGRLKNLGVFLDHEGLIRLRTRLLPGEVMEDSCPIVLPAKDDLTMKLIWKVHHVYSHAGVQTLQVLLREKFWIIHSRRTIQAAIRQCVKCRRYRAQPVKVPEGCLPADRIRMGPAFDVTGVDMAGPLHVKGKKKLYIAIFTCATYRAIHLELCSALTTEVFILALRRFVARRGRPSTIYSDNGLNFVGCSNALKNVDWAKITDHASSFQIRWKFNPPNAAWSGGFWERMIGVVKQLLRSVLGSARVNHEELETLLCDVESVVNSRPLTYVSEQADELRPLTPNDFIRNGGSSLVPDVDAVERDHLILRYRNIQHCREELRNRFQKEYLALLVSHGKSRKGRMIKVGDVVLVGSDMRKRIDWPMGLVVEVTPGNDGHVRRVLVKTAGGIFSRPAQRLYHLEINKNDN